MTLPPALSLSPDLARRFARRVLLLDEPVGDIGAALRHHGYVQIDPINVCGRMHDLILRNRVRNYTEGGLMRFLHGYGSPLPPQQRTGFEHHLPATNILAAFPLEAWPHLLGAMQHRARARSAWSGKLTPRERTLADRILAEIAVRGPLSSDEIDDSRRARRVWGAATLAKSTLQKLFFHGRVLISHRVSQRRYYDLPERILPRDILSSPLPSSSDTARWLVLLKFRQRRLVMLKRDELPHVADLVQPIAVDGCPRLFCLRTDLPVLDSVRASSEAHHPLAESTAPSPLLLAPLDPLIYDRRVTRALWNFDYTWEVYTPPAKRIRGYYALPLLVGPEIAGHVDPKADRLNGRLRVVHRSVRRGFRAAPAVSALARFLGLRP